MKPIATELDRMVAYGTKICTTVEVIYEWFFYFLPNFESIEKIPLVKFYCLFNPLNRQMLA